MEIIKLLLYNNNIIIIIIIMLMQLLLNFIPNIDCNQILITQTTAIPTKTIITTAPPKTTTTPPTSTTTPPTSTTTTQTQATTSPTTTTTNPTAITKPTTTITPTTTTTNPTAITKPITTITPTTNPTAITKPPTTTTQIQTTTNPTVTTTTNANQSTSKPPEPEDDKIIKIITYSTKIEIQILNDTYDLIIMNCDSKDFKTTKLLLGSMNKNKTICDNLRPCKTYIVTATLMNKLTSQNRTIIQKAQTKYALPEITVEQIMPLKDSIQISWHANNSECILNYTINGKSDGSSTSFVCGNECNDATLKDLNSCQNYSIEMISYDVKDTKIFHKNFSAETDVTDPGPVKSIKFELQPNNSTIKAIWEPPDNRYCIHFYDLNWALLNEININDSKKLLWNHYNLTDTKTNEFIIKNLTGCEEYIFKITANGDEINNSLNSTFNSSIQVSGPVQDLKIQSKFSTNITIEWKPPEHHMKCIKKYKLELFGPYKIHKIYEIDETHIFINDLKPCGKYNLTIKPIMINEIEGQQSDIGFTMEHDKPSVVLNITADSYPKEILIEWKIPEFSELCIQNYRISAWYENDKNEIENSFSNTTEETKITIKSLKSCTLYSIQIIATTGKYDGVPGLIRSKTRPTQSAPPDNIEVKLATHNSLELRARDTDPTNCQILSVRFSCRTDDDVKIKFGETIVDVKGAIGAIGLYSGTVKPLSPNVKYNCRVAIFNIAGWSVNNEAVCETGKYYPDTPDSIYINHTTLNSIHILWKPPKYPNGNIVMYKLHIQTLRPLYKVPSDCPDIDWIKKTIEVSKNELLFQDGIPFVEYGIQVAVMNDFGVSEFSNMIRVSTKAAEPSSIEYFEAVEIIGPSLNENNYEASALLKWKLPCRTNGKIKYFQLDFIGTHRNRSAIYFTRKYPNNSDPSINDYEIFQWNETQLVSDYNYIVYIKMYLEEGYESSNTTTRFLSPAGIPRKLNITGKGIVDAFLAKNPTSSALVKISNDLFTLNAENILYAALLVSEKNCQKDPNLEFGVIDSNYHWPNISNWFQVQLEQECIKQYQTTPVRWIPSNDIDGYYLSRAEGNIHYTPYTIGIEKNCNDRPNDYCNGPLKPGTSYSVVLRFFTRSGYNDVAQLSFYTDTEVRLLLVILLVVTCLLLAFFSGIIYLWISRRMKWHRESINGMANINRDVNAKNFLLHYTEISKRDKLMREFKELSTLTNDLDLSINASKSNESKNRYSNIYPYDRNRVILDSDSEGSDYINASFINGYKKKKEYIATQGPKPDCFIDFWRMILQYNVRVIVMLTEMKEGETIKCHQYFPLHSSDVLKFGHNITITCKKEINHDSIYERRELLVKHSGYGLQQNIIHYFFKKWPDHDCPNDPTELIHFMRKIRSEKIPKRSPIVVHCSAGCGRTGTLIGLDIIMQRLKSENSINIFETVKELRYQRIKMVQTIQQYQFLYKCAFQLVKKNFSPTNKFSNSSRSDSCNNTMHISNSSMSLNGGVNTATATGGIGSHIITNISDEQFPSSRLNKSSSNISLNGIRNSRQYQQQQPPQIHQSKSFVSNEIETSM